MNSRDLKIIASLRQNSRMPLTKMSKSTRIPVSTIFDRLQKGLPDLITKHTSLLDYSKMGFHARASISLKVGKDDRAALQDFLMKHPSVNSLYKVNNGFDFMIEGVFRQITDLEQFIEALEMRFSLLEHKSYFIIEDLKRESFLSDPELLFWNAA